MAKTRLRIPSHDNGMTSSIPASVVPQEEGYSRLLFNMDFDDVPGVVKIRPAKKPIFPVAPGVIKGMGMISSISGLVQYLIAVGQDIYIYDGISQWLSIKTWALPSGDRVVFSVLGERIIVSDGVNIPFSYNGTVSTDLTNMPKATIIETYKGRIFANDVNNHLAIQACSPLEPNNWDAYATGSRAFYAYDGDGEVATAYLAMDDYLLIGKKTSLHALVGVTTASFEQYSIHKQIGIGSAQAAIMVGSVAYFPDVQGNVYRLEAGDKPRKISTPIGDYIKLVDLDKIEETCAIVLRNDQYVITFPKTGGGHMTFAYDTERSRWRMWDVHMTNSMLSRHAEHSEYYFTIEDKQQIYRFDYSSYLDSTDTEIDAYMDTMELHMGVPEQEKEFYTLWIGAWVMEEDYDLEVFCRLNQRTEWVKLSVNSPITVKGDTGDYTRYRVAVFKTGRNIQFRIRNKGKYCSILDTVLTFDIKELE